MSRCPNNHRYKIMSCDPPAAGHNSSPNSDFQFRLQILRCELFPPGVRPFIALAPASGGYGAFAIQLGMASSGSSRQQESLESKQPRLGRKWMGPSIRQSGQNGNGHPGSATGCRGRPQGRRPNVGHTVGVGQRIGRRPWMHCRWFQTKTRHRSRRPRQAASERSGGCQTGITRPRGRRGLARSIALHPPAWAIALGQGVGGNPEEPMGTHRNL